MIMIRWNDIKLYDGGMMILCWCYDDDMLIL